MLKGLHPLLNADLLAVLAAMGHGDELALVDANFPAASVARRLVRLDGVRLAEAAEAIFTVLPLDTFVDSPLAAMAPVDDPTSVPAVQAEVQRLAEQAEGRPLAMQGVERHAFYERARAAFAVVATGEPRPYGCLLFVKGVIVPDWWR